MPHGQPFLKWVGGKGGLLPDLLRYVPQHIKTYYEPFLGGGALFWKLASEGRFDRAQISDFNAELVILYQIVRDKPVEFMEAVDNLANLYRSHPDPEAVFKTIRSDKPLTLIDRAARFLFLNKTCFNGLHRMNKKGEFNSPWGKEVNVTFFDPENIWACSELLQGVEIQHRQYYWLLEARAEDFVYFDPPYLPVSHTADFSSYTKEGFTLEDQKRLAMLFQDLSERGVRVMLSNSDVPEIRSLYAGFDIKVIKARRSVNSKADARGPVNEVLVLGKGVTEAQDPFDLLHELDQEFDG